MYWNNPIETIDYPSDSDIIFKATHNGQHVLYYDPEVSINHVAKQTHLQELCDWANNVIQQNGRQNFTKDESNHYDCANLVKINQMVDSLACHGSVKPMLLFFTGNYPYTTGTGDTRLRAFERLPYISTVSGIISTHTNYREKFSHLKEIKTLDDFAQCFKATPGSQFLIRLTDSQAPYGIDWYEYALHDSAVSVPSWDFCLSAIQNYINQQPVDFEFTVEWFDQLVNWSAYVDKTGL
jgi:hypothetical protein